MSESIVLTKSFDFAVAIIELYKILISQHEYVISKQLLRCGTSIGANVHEAVGAQSRRDFLSKMSIASKEARETIYWLRVLQKSQLVKQNFDQWRNMAEELSRILVSIVKTTAEAGGRP
jgi:four helix bundle protein